MILACFLFIHCKDIVLKIRNKCSQKWNCTAPFPIPTFMYLWEIYIFPGSVCLFCCSKIDGPILGIYPPIHECGNWEAGRIVSFLGIHKSDLLCGVPQSNSGFSSFRLIKILICSWKHCGYWAKRYEMYCGLSWYWEIYILHSILHFPPKNIGISLPTGVSPPHVGNGSAVTLSQLFANEFISLSPLLLHSFRSWLHLSGWLRRTLS